MSANGDPTALVVEDEVNLADLYATWLEERYGVRTAYSGQDALNELDGDVDVVLLDRRMPGLSGDEVLEAIRERGYDCRVAMVTAVEPDFDIIDMGFDDYLVKPVSREDLFGTVEGLLARDAYDRKLDEYAELVTKKATLEVEKPDDELEESEEFGRLESEIERLERDVDPLAAEFDDDDAAALFRDISPSGV